MCVCVCFYSSIYLFKYIALSCHTKVMMGNVWTLSVCMWQVNHVFLSIHIPVRLLTFYIVPASSSSPPPSPSVLFRLSLHLVVLASRCLQLDTHLLYFHMSYHRCISPSGNLRCGAARYCTLLLCVTCCIIVPWSSSVIEFLPDRSHECQCVVGCGSYVFIHEHQVSTRKRKTRRLVGF